MSYQNKQTSKPRVLQHAKTNKYLFFLSNSTRSRSDRPPQHPSKLRVSTPRCAREGSPLGTRAWGAASNIHTNRREFLFCLPPRQWPPEGVVPPEGLAQPSINTCPNLSQRSGSPRSGQPAKRASRRRRQAAEGGMMGYSCPNPMSPNLGKGSCLWLT